MSEVLQHFPLQLLSYQDLLEAIEQAAQTILDPGSPPELAEPLRGLLAEIRGALMQVYLDGASARMRGLERVEQLLAQVETSLGPDHRRELRLAYITLLDRIYGALFLQVVRHTPTAMCTPEGHFSLGGVLLSRQARLPHGERSALETLMRLLEDGAFRLELEYRWEPLGRPAGGEAPRPIRHR